MERTVVINTRRDRPADVTLVTASHISPAARATIVNAAYADYFVPTHLSEAQMRRMDEIYDVDLERSVVARAGEALVGMAMLSQRGTRGWVSSVGVAPEWRRQGIARMMMARLMEAAADAGMTQVTLEVIDRNAAAQRLYEGFGFCVERELLTWLRGADADLLPVPDDRLALADPTRMLGDHAGWHDQPTCWQRSPATLGKMLPQMRGYRLIPAHKSGWGIRPQHTGYVLLGEMSERAALLDVGLDPDANPLRTGRALLQALAGRYRGKAISISNVPADDRLNRILAALGFIVTVRQLEMRVMLDGRV